MSRLQSPAPAAVNLDRAGQPAVGRQWAPDGLDGVRLEPVQVATRAIVMLHKTQRPVQFEITQATRDAL